MSDVPRTDGPVPQPPSSDPTVAFLPPASPEAAEVTLPPSGPAVAPAPGRVTVPGYEIEGELGRGGMGVVYRARQVGLNRPVALKMILAGGHAGAAALARFRAEGEAVARLAHPNIVQVYEVGEADGLPFFSLEYVDGGSLADRLDGTPWPARPAAELVAALAEAMAAAHRAGVVHRDLKPGNVLLQRSEVRGQRSEIPPSDLCPLTSDLSPKITDFGLAKDLDRGGGQTETGSILGTPSYMAPEQAGGRSKEVGPAADVYALGAILYELLTGRPPFKAATPVDTVLQVLGQEPVPPRRLQPAVPRDLETIALKCLEKEPGKRYPSADALAADLRHFLAGEPIRARPVSGLERAVKWARRRPAVAGLLAVCAAALAGLVAVGVRSELAVRRHNAELAAALAAADAEHRRAEDRLHQALAAVDRMAQAGSDALAGDPESEPQRRLILEQALDLYRGFLSQESADPAVRRKTARAYFQTAGLALLLGDTARAEEACRAAVAMQKQLTAEFPDHPEYLNDLALSLGYQGHIAATANRYGKSLTLYAESLALSERLVREHPGTADFLVGLINAHRSLALSDLFRARDQAEQHLRTALASAEELARLEPGTARSGELLAATLDQLAALRMNRNDLAGAAGLIDRAGKALESVPDGPGRTGINYRETLAAHQVWRGELLARLGRPAEAAPLLRTGTAALERLLKVRPSYFPHRLLLLGAYPTLADIAGRLKQPAEAEAAYRKAVTLGESLVRDYPSFAGWAPQFDDWRIRAAIEVARRGDHARAVAEVSALADRAGQNPLNAYNLACVYAQASAAARKDGTVPTGEGVRLAEKHAGQAVALLARVEAASVFRQPLRRKELREDPDLDPLRERDDFRKLLARVEDGTEK
jgi:tetratricopeptide (TPR) repeat protein